MGYNKKLNTRKRKIVKRRKTTKRGGGEYIHHAYNNSEREYEYGEQHTTELEKRTYNNKWVPPVSYIDSLTNVSIDSNNDNNYKYFGMLIMVVKRPNDVSTIKWAINKYLNDKVMPVLMQNNERGINYTLEHIKINNFKIVYNTNNNTSDYYYENVSITGDFFITGSIYVYDAQKLNEEINKKVYDKLPDDIGREINTYM